MIYSNKRKLCLSGWLQGANEDAYLNSLRLQKFLFMYEAFSKADHDKYDFDSLKGYKRGPVFSTVWGDYTKERAAFNSAAKDAYYNSTEPINLDRAHQCSFIVSSLAERDLSDLTHSFHIWYAQQDRIEAGEYQVVLNENDFNQHDEQLVASLKTMYPLSIVQDSCIIPLGGKRFIVSKNDEKNLTAEHYDVLWSLSKQPELHNPVYVSIDDGGRILVD